MDQKQLDDLESNETREEQSSSVDEENLTPETSDFSDLKEPSEEDSLDEGNETGVPEAEPSSEVEVPKTADSDEQSESDATSEEKVNDVNDILDNGDNNKTEEKVEENKTETTASSSGCSTSSGCNAASNPEEEKENPWNADDDTEKKPGSTWRTISGVLLILLVVAVYTNGFNFTGAATIDASITQIDAEDTILDYVNNNLLQPPFTATVESSEELDNLFKITLDVAGQEIDSYITKDGKFFFPQGFDLEAPLDLEAPETELVEVSVDDDPMKGDLNAPVTIIEFSEYQCPFCKKYVDETYQKIMEEYVDTGKVRYIFRDFPLGFHPNAKPAAIASECAHEQGKFWEYHDLLFENQNSLNLENYKKWAVDLGLDTEQFNGCLDSEKYKKEVEKDLADGQSYGVSGTPAFFVNGKMISGAQPFAAFKQAIEEALQSEGSQEVELEEQIEEVAEVLEEEIETQEPTGTKEIQISVKKWRFDPKVVEVNQGDEVKLVIASKDFDLKFILTSFGVSKTITAGEPVTIEFVADKKGTFEFICGDYCNKYGAVQGAALKGELVVS